jgi:dipeptidyl aminopeptidase/acylaminoacyl peptidase
MARLPRESTAVQNCWTWVKWAFILPILINGSLYKNDCVIIHDSDGTRLVHMVAFQEIEHSARFSIDRQYIAFAYDEYSNDNISLHIYNRAGQLVSYNNLYEQFPDSCDDPEFDWLPDGRLVYMVDQTIYNNSAL